MKLLELEVSEYLLQEEDRMVRIGRARRPQVVIKRMRGLDASRMECVRWSLTYNSSAYSKKHGCFICEDSPSSRDGDYFEDMRFIHPEDALLAWEEYEGWEKTGIYEEE